MLKGLRFDTIDDIRTNWPKILQGSIKEDIKAALSHENAAGNSVCIEEGNYLKRRRKNILKVG